MRTVKAITGMNAAERFYEKLSGAVRYMLPAATALAFLSLSTDAQAQTPSTSINLTSLSINENEAVGTAVGFLSTTDIDLESHTYALVPGVGDDDNASFDILANKLQTNEVFNFEVKSTYSIRIATTGDDGLTLEQQFNINIDDVNDKPVLSSVTRSVLQGNILGLTLSDFELAYSDEDGHALDYIEIKSLPAEGTLMLFGIPLSISDIVVAPDLDFVSYDAPSTVVGQVSFDWAAFSSGESSDADGSVYIRVTRSRVQGTATDVELITDSIPSGSTVTGHPGPGARPSSLLGDPNTATGAAIPGRRPGGFSADPTFAKLGEEGGVEAQLDLNVVAFPNPFASEAEISFTLPEDAVVEVNVYNYMGALVQQVVSGMQSSGVNTLKIGSDLSNGSYIYTVKVLDSDGQTALYRTGGLVKMN